jgi:hypothetical protein
MPQVQMVTDFRETIFQVLEDSDSITLEECLAQVAELEEAQVLQMVAQVVTEVTDKQFIPSHQQLQILATAVAEAEVQDQVVLA